MNATWRSSLQVILRGMCWILALVAFFAFFAGGKIISESYKVDRILAEMLGIGIAVAAGVGAAFLKSASDDYSGEEARSLDDHE